MKPKSKPWWVLKWTSTVACAAALGLWITTIAAPFNWVNANRSILAQVSLGTVRVVYLDMDTETSMLVHIGWGGARPPAPGWHRWVSYGFVLPSRNPRVLPLTVRATTTDYVVPCWLVLLVAAAPTAALWRRDRRRIPPGHCETCAYNLTGNVSGRCPECGSPTMQPSEERP